MRCARLIMEPWRQKHGFHHMLRNQGIFYPDFFVNIKQFWGLTKQQYRWKITKFLFLHTCIHIYYFYKSYDLSVKHILPMITLSLCLVCWSVCLSVNDHESIVNDYVFKEANTTQICAYSIGVMVSSIIYAKWTTGMYGSAMMNDFYVKRGHTKVDGLKKMDGVKMHGTYSFCTQNAHSLLWFLCRCYFWLPLILSFTVASVTWRKSCY